MDRLLQELGLLELKQVLATDTGHPAHAVKKSQICLTTWLNLQKNLYAARPLDTAGRKFSPTVHSPYEVPAAPQALMVSFSHGSDSSASEASEHHWPSCPCCLLPQGCSWAASRLIHSLAFCIKEKQKKGIP